MVDYYDKVLFAIPAVLLLGALASLHEAVALYQGLGLGSLLATAVLFDALFRNPPTQPTTSHVGAVLSVGLSWLFTIWLFL